MNAAMAAAGCCSRGGLWRPKMSVLRGGCCPSGVPMNLFFTPRLCSTNEGGSHSKEDALAEEVLRLEHEQWQHRRRTRRISAACLDAAAAATTPHNTEDVSSPSALSTHNTNNTTNNNNNFHHDHDHDHDLSVDVGEAIVSEASVLVHEPSAVARVLDQLDDAHLAMELLHEEELELEMELSTENTCDPSSSTNNIVKDGADPVVLPGTTHTPRPTRRKDDQWWARVVEDETPPTQTCVRQDGVELHVAIVQQDDWIRLTLPTTTSSTEMHLVAALHSALTTLEEEHQHHGRHGSRKVAELRLALVEQPYVAHAWALCGQGVRAEMMMAREVLFQRMLALAAQRGWRLVAEVPPNTDVLTDVVVELLLLSDVWRTHAAATPSLRLIAMEAGRVPAPTVLRRLHHWLEHGHHWPALHHMLQQHHLHGTSHTSIEEEWRLVATLLQQLHQPEVAAFLMSVFHDAPPTMEVVVAASGGWRRQMMLAMVERWWWPKVLRCHTATSTLVPLRQQTLEEVWLSYCRTALTTSSAPTWEIWMEAVHPCTHHRSTAMAALMASRSGGRQSHAPWMIISGPTLHFSADALRTAPQTMLASLAQVANDLDAEMEVDEVANDGADVAKTAAVATLVCGGCGDVVEASDELALLLANVRLYCPAATLMEQHQLCLLMFGRVHVLEAALSSVEVAAVAVPVVPHILAHVGPRSATFVESELTKLVELVVVDRYNNTHDDDDDDVGKKMMAYRRRCQAAAMRYLAHQRIPVVVSRSGTVAELLVATMAAAMLAEAHHALNHVVELELQQHLGMLCPPHVILRAWGRPALASMLLRYPHLRAMARVCGDDARSCAEETWARLLMDSVEPRASSSSSLSGAAPSPPTLRVLLRLRDACDGALHGGEVRSVEDLNLISLAALRMNADVGGLATRLEERAAWLDAHIGGVGRDV